MAAGVPLSLLPYCRTVLQSCSWKKSPELHDYCLAWMVFHAASSPRCETIVTPRWVGKRMCKWHSRVSLDHFNSLMVREDLLQECILERRINAVVLLTMLVFMWHLMWMDSKVMHFHIWSQLVSGSQDHSILPTVDPSFFLYHCHCYLTSPDRHTEDTTYLVSHKKNTSNGSACK